MPSNHTLEDFVFSASTACTPQALQLHLDRFLASFGIEGYRIVPATLPLLKQIYTLLEFDNKPHIAWPASPPGPSQLQTLKDIAHKTVPGWREYYQENQLFRHDPILLKEIISRGPFTRSEAIAEFNNKASSRLIDISKEFGTLDNITMSQWLAPDTLVGVSFYLRSENMRFDERGKRLLQTAGFLFCARYQELASPPQTHQTPKPQLTIRECDVLHWVAQGKTKPEIAEHLEISLSCVKRHCENARLKLGVNNMSSALARAMSYGYISI